MLRSTRIRNYKPEYFAGYGWLAHWKPWDDAGLRLGGGFTATVTLKSSYSNYMVPVPVLLPIAEVAWDKFSIMGLYVPRLSSNRPATATCCCCGDVTRSEPG